MPNVNFNRYEAEALAHLAHHYDQHSGFMEIEDFYKYNEVGEDQVVKTIASFGSFPAR